MQKSLLTVLTLTTGVLWAHVGWIARACKQGQLMWLHGHPLTHMALFGTLRRSPSGPGSRATSRASSRVSCSVQMPRSSAANLVCSAPCTRRPDLLFVGHERLWFVAGVRHQHCARRSHRLSRPGNVHLLRLFPPPVILTMLHRSLCSARGGPHLNCRRRRQAASHSAQVLRGMLSLLLLRSALGD